MNNFSKVFILLLVFVYSDVQAQKRQKIKKGGKSEYIASTLSPGGYEYDLFKNGYGDIAKNGDKVYFDLIIKYRDSILEDSRRMPRQPEFIIPEVNEAPNPVIDALRLSRAQDSIVMHERLDTVQGLPPEMEGWKEITYHIKVKKIINQESRKNVMMREAEVEKIVLEDIDRYKSKKYDKIIQTESGVQCFIHEEGKGAVPRMGENVEVYYYGATLENGKKFDSSFADGVPFTVPVGRKQVIDGWEEALSILKRGTKATLIIPASLAYGSRGIDDLIAPDTDLVFYIEILDK